ncbi:unnamed protein product [Urochloa decumbens]|uniref:Ionotropic glutamate receptor C-terminal domain-containing protein n=1 Tax=Urochloa decumbens TaxID=240449 RepID=A0ABC9CTU4_9POAL
MKSILQILGIFSCLCYCTLGQNVSVGPDVVNIGVLCAFDSTIGRVAKVAIAAAINDINNDSSILSGTKLVAQMQDTNYSGFIGIVQALQFMEKDTVAIIGPQSSVVAHVISHVANELQVPLMSFAATDPTLTSLQYPFFVRTIHSDQFQMASVADLVDYYGWNMVTAVYIDDDYGRNGIATLGDELAKRRLKILYKAAIRPGAKKSEMAAVLVKAAMMESRVFVLHAHDDSGLAVFSLAYNLTMTSGGYVWIATDWLSAVLDSVPRLDSGLLSTMQGVLTLRQHTGNTNMKKTLVSQWSTLVKEESGGSGFLLNSFGFYAYDSVWMLAHALDAFFSSGGNISFSPDPRLHAVAGGALNLDALSIFDGGMLLLEKIRKVNFMGAAGPVKLDSDGNLIHPAYDIINIIGSGLRTIGYWSNYSGLSIVSPETLYKKPPNGTIENQKLRAVFWPGETTTTPRGWVFANNGNELRIGVPNRVSYRQFVSADNQTGMVSGFCIDVFAAAINLLPYPVAYRFIPFGSGRENPSYTQLINQIVTDEFDAVVGDVAIVTNRTKVVDFTQPYVGSGLVILTSVKSQGSDGWAFLQPFTIRMWLVTGVFFLIVGTVVWLLEHRINDDFRGPPAKQVQFLNSVLCPQRGHQEHAGAFRDHHLAVRSPDHPVQLHCQPDLNPHRAAADVPDQGHRQPDRQRRPHRVPGRLLRRELPGARARRVPVAAQEPRLSGRVQGRAGPRPSQRRCRGHRRRAPLRRALPDQPRQVRHRGGRVHQERLGLRVPAGLAAGGGPVDGDPDAVGDRRPAEDPRQVAVDGAVVGDDRPAAGPAARVHLLGAVPHLRRGVRRRAGRPRLRARPPVLPPRRRRAVVRGRRHLPLRPPQQHPVVPVLRRPPGGAVPGEGLLQGPRGARRVRLQQRRQQLHVQQRQQHVFEVAVA